MRKTILLLSVVLGLLAVLPAGARQPSKHMPSEKKMGAYLFTFFNDPTHSLFMAVSYDGYTFTAVNDGKPVIGGKEKQKRKIATTFSFSHSPSNPNN